MSKAIGWFFGWLVLVIGLAMYDVPAWYRVAGIVCGTLIALVGLVADSPRLTEKSDEK